MMKIFINHVKNNKVFPVVIALILVTGILTSMLKCIT
jgi:hypothetical protein